MEGQFLLSMTSSFNSNFGHIRLMFMMGQFIKKISPVGTDGRLPLSDVDLDLGSGHMAYRRASLIDLYLRTKFH